MYYTMLNVFHPGCSSWSFGAGTKGGYNVFMCSSCGVSMHFSKEYPNAVELERFPKAWEPGWLDKV